MWKMPSEPMPKRAVRRCTNRNMHLAFCSRSRNNLTNAGVGVCVCVCALDRGTRAETKSENTRMSACRPCSMSANARDSPARSPGVYRRAVFPPAARRSLCSRHVHTHHIRSSSIQFGTPDADILPERKHAPLVFESRATSLCQLVRRGNPSRCKV